MNDSLASTLVLCDLDNLLLGEDGNLTQVVRDVLQLFSSRGGRLTVFFSQRSPRAVRSILGSVRLAAPALVCGGTMAYHYADGNRVPLCSFAQQQELFACLPDTPRCGRCRADAGRHHPGAAHEQCTGAPSAAGVDSVSAGERRRHPPRAGAAGVAVSGQQVCAPDLVGRKGHRGSCCPAG